MKCIQIITILTCISGSSTAQTIKDPQGHSYTTKLMPDNHVWMTQNLNIQIPGSYCYNDSIQYCTQYGRLYAWQAAQEVCTLLGAGWRLPTNEEWQQLGKQYGGVRDDSKDKGNAAYKALIPGGSSGMNIQFAGGRVQDGSYARINDHGFYWTATATDSASAWLYNFGKGAAMMNRHADGEKQRAFAVRCIRDNK
jgi:uncharacterized protein (TIGR02145 family)